MENRGQAGSLNHLGVEDLGTDAVEAEQADLAKAGLASVEERDTTCCYAEAYRAPRAPPRYGIGPPHSQPETPSSSGTM